jgi:hypothetical protein
LLPCFLGRPQNFRPRRAHYSSLREKAANAVAHGAVGLIILDSPWLEQIYGFKLQLHDLAFPSLRWLGPEGKPNDAFEELRAGAFLSMEGVKKLCDGSGRAPDDLYKAAQESRPMSFVLPATAKIHVVTQLEPGRSPNVVAQLRGSDPALREE